MWSTYLLLMIPVSQLSRTPTGILNKLSIIQHPPPFFVVVVVCFFVGFFLYSSTPCLFFNTKITVFVNYELMLFWITAALFTLHAAAYSTSSGPLYWLPFSLYPWNSATHSLNSSVPIIPWSLMPHYFKKRGWAWSPLKWADPSGGEVRVLRQHPESSTVGS